MATTAHHNELMIDPHKCKLFLWVYCRML